MMKVSLFFCLFLFLFSCSAEETLHQASKIQFETLNYDGSAHDLSTTSSICSRAPTNGSKRGPSLRLEVVHRYGPCADQEGSKKEDALTLAEILAKDQLRVESIQAAAGNTNKSNYTNKEAEDYGPTQLPAHQGTSLGTANYVVTIALGTPKHKLTLLIDTGSVLTWTQCQPCYPRDCYPQNEPLFKPSDSSTYSRIPCSSHFCTELGDHKRGGPGCIHRNIDCTYKVYYGGGASSTGFYSRDRLTLSLGDVFHGFRFGCGNANTVSARFAGILGLGRGPLSFVAQTEAKYSRLFSYCLPPDASSTGFIAFGGEDYYKNIKGMSFTPLVPGPSSDHYYIQFTAIGVGGYQLPIKDSVFTTARAVIDSGTVLTRLPPEAYAALDAEFTKQMEALGHASEPRGKYSLDTCFSITKYNEKIPKVSFTFKGGATINLAGSGILYYISSGKACLAFLSNKNPTALAIFGNTQQRTLEVMYDMPKNLLGFRSNPQCF